MPYWTNCWFGEYISYWLNSWLLLEDRKALVKRDLYEVCVEYCYNNHLAHFGALFFSRENMAGTSNGQVVGSCIPGVNWSRITLQAT